jgi:signal transduction histidine kinase
MAPRANILLVDDKPERLLSYEAILAQLDQNLVRASSGEEALARLMESDFAAILLDVNMPGMDGFETASMIRGHPRFERTPIIFVTGVHLTDLDRLRAYRMGAVDYVFIPVVPEILRGKVQVLVQLHLQQRELSLLNRELAAANVELAAAHRALEVENRDEQERLNRNLEQSNVALAETNTRLLAEVAERTKAERLLHAEARRKDEFIAILAHELRNPLAAIRTGVHVLGSETIDAERGQWVREMLTRQVDHLVCLVDDLLDVSRMTHGRIELKCEPLDLEGLVQHVVGSSQTKIDEAGISLHVDVQPSLVVHGDAVRLFQVLDNLISNAVRHTPAGGAISIRVQGPEASGGKPGWVSVEVADSGVGIAEDMLDRVFEIFVQAPPGVGASNKGGLGIGLALVRGLVELHGGTVSASSAGPNRGATFTVHLPLAKAIITPAADQPRTQTVLAPPLRILIIDDNEDSSQGLSICLQGAGHRVLLAASGAAGIELARERDLDVILLDIGLPDIDGYQVAARLREYEPLRAKPLIAISGFGADDDRARAEAAGFNGYLVKPVSIDALQTALAEHVAGQPA